MFDQRPWVIKIDRRDIRVGTQEVIGKHNPIGIINIYFRLCLRSDALQ